MNESLRSQWRELLHTWGVTPDRTDEVYAAICQLYGGAGRYYHTIDHIRDVLEKVESLLQNAVHINAVKLAAWLHDVIYETRTSDNEERSADYAAELCNTLAIRDGRRVASLILKTKTHDAGADCDAQVLLDADLAILGADESDYLKYTLLIRKEYEWVPDSKFRSGRRKILERFLQRQRIYHHLHHLEESARRNITQEIGRL